MAPLISVIMSLQNNEAYVKEAIDSILGQSLDDFEFILFNDRSTDSTLDIVKTYDDPRIIFEDNTTITNYIDLLNKGLAKAKGKYIAQTDGDDISEPQRFEKTYNYLEKHPEVGVCGSRVTFIGEKQGPCDLPVEDKEIKTRLLIASEINQGSTLIRKQLFTDHNIVYDRDCIGSHDYKLWLELMEHTKFYNMDEYLFNYRIHQKNASFTSLVDKVSDNTTKIKTLIYKKVFPELAHDDIPILAKMMLRQFDDVQWEDLQRIYKKLKSNEARYIDKDLFFLWLDKNIYKYAVRNTRQGLKNYKSFKSFGIQGKFVKKSRQFELLVKSLFSLK